MHMDSANYVILRTYPLMLECGVRIRRHNPDCCVILALFVAGGQYIFTC